MRYYAVVIGNDLNEEMHMLMQLRHQPMDGVRTPERFETQSLWLSAHAVPTMDKRFKKIPRGEVYQIIALSPVKGSFPRATGCSFGMLSTLARATRSGRLALKEGCKHTNDHHRGDIQPKYLRYRHVSRNGTCAKSITAAHTEKLNVRNANAWRCRGANRASFGIA